MARLNLVVVSGLSGSGKSHALKAFEDAGYFCIDNLPPALLPLIGREPAEAGRAAGHVRIDHGCLHQLGLPPPIIHVK